MVVHLCKFACSEDARGGKPAVIDDVALRMRLGLEIAWVVP
jgi:hypothetical protein